MSHVPFTLQDGTTGSCQPQFLDMVLDVDRRLSEEREKWVAELRAAGAKAAHPDDGWVYRELDRVVLEYPYYNDGLAVGDLLALGWPGKPTRLVRIAHVATPQGITLGRLTYWYFKRQSWRQGDA